jgi:hypothetical protein
MQLLLCFLLDFGSGGSHLPKGKSIQAAKLSVSYRIKGKTFLLSSTVNIMPPSGEMSR